MAKSAYIGDTTGIAKKIKKMYVGDENGVARKVKKAYIGDANGVARLFYSGGTGKFMTYSQTSATGYIVNSENLAVSRMSGNYYQNNYPNLLAYSNDRWICATGKYKKLKYTFDGVTWTEYSITYYKTASHIMLASEDGYTILFNYVSNERDVPYSKNGSITTFSNAEFPLNGMTPYGGKCPQYIGNGVFIFVSYECATLSSSSADYLKTNSINCENGATQYRLNQTLRCSSGHTYNKEMKRAFVIDKDGYVVYYSNGNTTGTKSTKLCTVAFDPKTLVYGNGMWIFIDDWSNSGTKKIYKSTDCITWTSIGTTPWGTADYAQSLTYGNGYFIACVGTNMYYSRDCVTWTVLTSLDSWQMDIVFQDSGGHGEGES